MRLGVGTGVESWIFQLIHPCLPLSMPDADDEEHSLAMLGRILETSLKLAKILLNAKLFKERYSPQVLVEANYLAASSGSFSARVSTSALSRTPRYCNSRTRRCAAVSTIRWTSASRTAAPAQIPAQPWAGWGRPGVGRGQWAPLPETLPRLTAWSRCRRDAGRFLAEDACLLVDTWQPAAR